MSFQAFCFVKV